MARADGTIAGSERGALLELARRIGLRPDEVEVVWEATAASEVPGDGFDARSPDAYEFYAGLPLEEQASFACALDRLSADEQVVNAGLAYRRPPGARMFSFDRLTYYLLTTKGLWCGDLKPGGLFKQPVHEPECFRPDPYAVVRLLSGIGGTHVQLGGSPDPEHTWVTIWLDGEDSSERGNEIASVFGTRVERWDIRSDPEATIYFASGP